MYIIARMRWADGYISDGNPDNRYAKSGGWGFHIWTSLLATCAPIAYITRAGLWLACRDALFRYRYVTAASTGLGVMGVL